MTVKKAILTLFSLFLILNLNAIDIDGNDLDWGYEKSVTFKDITNNVDPAFDIRYIRWTMDSRYLYVLIKQLGDIERRSPYTYMLNIDLNFDELADLNLRTGVRQPSELALVNSSGEITEVKRLGGRDKIKMKTGSSVEYRVPLSMLGERIQISCAVWDSENYELVESSLWHYIELDRRALEEPGPDLSVALKHLSGKKHGSSKKLKVDGKLNDWASLKYSEVEDKTAIYYQSAETLYIIADKRVLFVSDDMVYYITIDSNLDGKDDFLIAVRADQSGFLQVGNKVYKMSSYDNLKAAVNEQVEFSIPLKLLPKREFKASIGLWNEDTKEVYYYTAWMSYRLEEKEPESKKEKSSVKEEIEEEIKKVTEKEPQPSGVNALLAKIKDPQLKIKVQKFIAQGIEDQFSLNSVSTDQIVKSSYKFQGIPYIYGRADAGGTDCSGLTYMIFKPFNIILSRSAQTQARTGKIISSREELKPGDLIFFYRTYPTSNLITHVGLYLGDNKFINANSYYKKVMVEDVYDKYWDDKFIFGTRGE